MMSRTGKSVTEYVTDADGRRRKLMIYGFEIPLDSLPESFDGLRIVHLSDLHKKRFGQNNAELVRICKRLSPDIICFTGDLFSRDEDISAIKGKLPFMKKLRRIAPVYYILGNHESEAPEKAALLCYLLKRAGIVCLRNKRVRLWRGESFISISGLMLPNECYRLADGSFRGLRPVTLSLVTRLIGRASRGCNILLSHTPLPFKAYAEWGADLTLSGHVHGGVVRLFGIGLLSPERKFFPRYSQGLYRIMSARGASFMEVSAGLGKFRINDPPSVTLCVLRRKKK